MKTTLLTFLGLVFIECGSGSGTEPTNDFQIDNPYDGIWQDSPEIPFRFVLEQTFGVDEEPEEAILSSLGSVVTDDAGNVYMLESRANRIVSFDPNGGFRWSAGREGEGPGELRQARTMIWDREQQLFISNQQGSRIEIFDLEGRFVDSRSLSEFDMTLVRLLGFLGPDQLVITTPKWGAFGMLITIISLREEWAIKSSFEIDQSGDLDLPQGISSSPTVAVMDNEIVVGHVSDYRFEFYDVSGQLIRIVTRAMDDLVRPGVYERGRARGIRSFSNLGAPRIFGDGYRIVSARWPTNVDDPDAFVQVPVDEQPEVIWEQTYDFFDENWHLLYSWTDASDNHAAPGGPLYSDSSGKLYISMKRDVPQLGRYRVEVKPPR